MIVHIGRELGCSRLLPADGRRVAQRRKSQNTELTVRSRVVVPIRLPDGGSVQATWVSFHGLPAGLPKDKEPVALIFGEPADRPLVRLHSECLTGDVFESLRCDCGPQLREALTRFAAESGILIYLRQEGRGIGLYNKLDAYVLQDVGADTFEANRMLGMADDAREYQVAADILRTLGHPGIRLLSNNPDKRSQLAEHGIEVAELVPTGVHVNQVNVRYLRTKVEYAGHQLAVDTAAS
jgi:GTP cyclohydrolase II